MDLFPSQSGAMAGQAGAFRNRFLIAGIICLMLVCMLAAVSVWYHSYNARQLALHQNDYKKVANNASPPLLPIVRQPIKAGTLTPSYDNVADAQAEPAPLPKVERFKIDHPVSIAGMLRDAGLDKAQRELWSQAFRSSAHWGILQPGHQLAVFKDPETGKIQALEYTLNPQSIIRAQAVGDGAVFATRETLRYEPQMVAYSLSLAHGLDIAAARKNVPKAVVEQIKDAFGTRLRRAGNQATLKLVYKELVTPDGSHRRDVDLKACKLQLGRHTFSVFSFHDRHGHEHLYDQDGNPLEQQFLRFPVVFKYISSPFSKSRYHPILHRFRPHVGVDLAAAYGTPVKAVADGTVLSAGWDGELGRCIRLEHDKNLISLYGHLSRIRPDVKPGASVRIGQVIGYVGSSGLSTGPHLHFAILKDGHYVNPLTADLDYTGIIPSDRRPLFERTKRQYEKVLAGLRSFQDAAADPAPVPAITFDEFDEHPAPVHIAARPSRSHHHHHVEREHPHLARGGVLREHTTNDSDALSRFIKGGLMGDPSL